ncbi:hypothetical protein [Scytonema sp. NUACC26]|uniref:hypothetical protein n=1 Tax=Scytonema sp. NUACC26 TaxID=3140176 RepID=UPI0038B3B86D
MQSFDTPLNQFKPILKPEPQLTLSSFQLPTKNWLLPLLIALGIVFVFWQCTFLQPATVSPNQSETMRINRK